MKKLYNILFLLFILLFLNGCFEKPELIINGPDSVYINETIYLTHNYDNNEIIKWYSSDDNIGFVEGGVVTGVAEGTITITATCDNKTATKLINVIYPSFTIEINSKNTLFVGEKYRFSAVIPEKYQNLDYGEWISENENIITIDNNGNSMPLSPGETNIIYKYFGNTVSTKVKVVYKEATSVILEGSDTVEVDSVVKLNTTFYPNNSQSECIYESSNENIATVDSDGNITGISVGKVTITVYLKNNKNIYSSKEINVIYYPNSISIKNKEQLSNVFVGEFNNLELYINDNKYDEIYQNLVKITVSDNKIIYANEYKFLGLSVGNVILKIESIFDSNIFDTVTINVTNIEEEEEFTSEQYKRVDEIIENMTLSQKVGQMFVIGFSGTSLSDSLKNAINNYNFGNVIYMGANVSNISTVSKLSKDIQDYMFTQNSVYGFISIDQEGGRVARIKNKGTHFISNMGIAATGNSEYAYLQGEAMAKELLNYGINMDFAPVLDVNNNHENPVIGVRSYGDNPLNVAEYGEKLISGLQTNGVIACPKHFPGHGNTNVDSHYGLPVINSNLYELYNVEFVPFINAINNGADCIMTTHIIFNAIDNVYPATLSEKVLTGLLRNEFNYDGLIATDGMEMNAVAKNYGDYDKTAVLAVKAGVDLLLYTSTNNPMKAHQGIIQAINNNEISEERINESVRRILLTKLKYNILDLNFNIVDDFEQLLQKNNDLNIKIACDSLTLAKGSYKSFDKSKKTLIIASTTTNIHNNLKNNLINIDYSDCYAINISNSSDYNNVIKLINEYDQVICLSSNLTADNKYYIDAVDLISKNNKDYIVVALDSPYDYLKYNENTVKNYICLYGNQDVTLIALTKFLNNEFTPVGKLPINESLFK